MIMLAVCATWMDVMQPDLRDMTMDAIMRRWPATIRVMFDFRLPCVGCPVAPFHNVSDAAREHQVDETALMRQLWKQVALSATDG